MCEHEFWNLRLVRVEAGIERLLAPPWIGELPFPERKDYWQGTSWTGGGSTSRRAPGRRWCTA
jgi:hypothetical protein